MIMSAVMSTLSMISGGRRAHRKLASRKSGQLSDAGETPSRDLDNHKRSASLQTLETGGDGVCLDKLEAKMADIAVSLGGRRRGAGARRELDALRSALQDKDSIIMSLKKQLNASLITSRLCDGPAATPPSPTPLSAEERRTLEDRAAVLDAELERRKAKMMELRRRLDHTQVTDNIDTRIEQAELQYALGREELEALAAGGRARALHALLRRPRAAHHRLLYSVVRELGGTATVLTAEARGDCWGMDTSGLNDAPTVEWARDNPSLRPGDKIIEVNGVSTLSSGVEEVHRAVRSASPARLVLLRPATAQPARHTHAPGITQSEAAGLRAEVDALTAAAGEAERAKRGLRADNTRLTHRISYLEEQVAELLARHTQVHSTSSNDSCITVNKTKKNVTNISITTDTQTRQSPKSEVQVFQKGPEITAIVAKLPGLNGSESSLPIMRPKSNASGASSRMAKSPCQSPTPNRSYSSHSVGHKAGRMRNSLSHHCIHANADYSTETDAALRMIERNQRHIEKQRAKAEKLNRSKGEEYKSDSDLESKTTRHSTSDIKKAAERIEESIKKTNWAERKTLSIIEQIKRSQKSRKAKKNDSSDDVQAASEHNYDYHRIDGKVLENAHKSSRRISRLYSRSAKSSEFESECSDFPHTDIYSSSPRIDYGSENRNHYEKKDEGNSRPTPPRKPLRLSLHKAKSAHSLLNGSDSETQSRSISLIPHNDVETPAKRPVKRTYASDKWCREKAKDASKATPRPSRKLFNNLSTCGAPAADALYPEDAHPHSRIGNADKRTQWC